tara:strand:- start:25 stop:1152 length:1128 start_codon:yes stop_codon:yes gene_type:complete
MIDADLFSLKLKKNGYEFISGVPDSLLKELCKSLDKTFKKHITATNEGSAVALAIGYYLGKKKPGIVYLQNSGLGNIINPITSLASPKVYGIPMLLLIGWRGEIIKKQIQDEPQHKMQGLITIDQLKLLRIPFKIINAKTTNISKIINNLKKISLKKNTPVALVIRKNTFSKSKFKTKKKKEINFYREDAIKEIILSTTNKKKIIISTTGMASRELYEVRLKNDDNTFQDFLTVGGMGHASQIATGLSLTTKKKIICIDGDGALLMHTGALGISAKADNLIHIVINNKSHDSVGGQETLGKNLNFNKIAKNFGYKYCYDVKKQDQISNILNKTFKQKGSCMIVINCNKGYRKDLGRPEKNMKLRKNNFIKFVNKI